MLLARKSQVPERDARPRCLIVGDTGDERAQIEGQIGDLAQLVTGAEEADLAVVVLDADPDAMMETARGLAAGGRAVIAVSRTRDPDAIVRAMRAGVRDFAYLGEEGDVRRAVEALGRVAVAAEPATRGRLIAVFGAKGGCGATTVATNLARALQTPEGRTVLVDLDVQRGDAQVFLDLAGGFGWHDLLRDLPRLDEELLERSLPRHESGLRVLAGTRPVEEAEPLPPGELALALRRLLAHSDHLVVDGLRAFDDAALTVLDLADTILLVLTQDVPALKNASRCLSVFRRLGYGPEKVKIVVNRHTRRGDLGGDAIADALGSPVHATIANDFPTVHGAIDAGRLLTDVAPRAHVTRDVQALAALLRQAEAAPGGRATTKGGRS